MDIDKINDKEFVCRMLETKYIRAMGREVSWKIGENSDLYPAGWFSNSDYIKKAEILAEAIEKKCLIIETSKYLEVIEGVRRIEKNDEEER